jgi:TolB-like protein/Tfp pilus assembly protein PilF
MFELTQTAELSHWQGEPADKAWLAFLDDVKRFVQPGAPAVVAVSSAAPFRATRQPEKLSICVLPFANMSADAEQEYFADGISEDIITDLSKVSALSVIARNTAFTFKGKSLEIPQVARQLGVTHVLEGSVRKAGNRVRITAQLIDGKAGDHVWAERWDRDLDDIFALQDEISEAIVGALKLSLFPEEKTAIESRATTDLEAYDKFLRARALTNNLAGPDDLKRATSLLHEVLEIDPEFAPARGVLATTYTLMLVFMPEAKQETLRALAKTVQEALDKAPDHWASHMANAILLDQRRDWLAADVAYAKALALAPPSEATVVAFSSVFLSSVGRNTEALDILITARSLDPLATAISTPLQQCLDRAGRPADAQAEYERTRDLPGGHEIPEHQAVMRLWESGDLAAIKAQARRFFDSQAVPMPALNAVYEVFDQPQTALGHLRSAVEDPAYQDSTRQFILALYAAHFGDQALALAALRRAYVDLEGLQPHIIWYPVMREARRTSAFKQLVRDLGLYDYWRASGHWGDFARPVGEDDFEIIG